MHPVTDDVAPGYQSIVHRSVGTLSIVVTEDAGLAVAV